MSLFAWLWGQSRRRTQTATYCSRARLSVLFSRGIELTAIGWKPGCYHRYLPGTGSPMFSNSDAYDRYMGRWSRRLAPLFVQFAHIQEGQTVLDLGCGTGQLSAGIAESVPVSSVTGVDRSPEYVGAARRRVQNPRAQR